MSCQLSGWRLSTSLRREITAAGRGTGNCLCPHATGWRPEVCSWQRTTFVSWQL